MAINDTPPVNIMLTKEGAARANQLQDNGLRVNVTHMRIYRSSTAVQDLPYNFTGNENRALINTWACFPNANTTFDIIEVMPDGSMPGYLQLIGTLGADVGTFSYDIVALFLEDDTLYALCSTRRLLTKRKAAFGTSSNVQELSFNILHSTVPKPVDFTIEDTVIDYTRISEVNKPSQLPKLYDVNNRIFRISDPELRNEIAFANNGDTFYTYLASQVLLGGAPIWIPHGAHQLFAGVDVQLTFKTNSYVEISLPKSYNYPIELLGSLMQYFITVSDPTGKLSFPATNAVYVNATTDSNGAHITLGILDGTRPTTEVTVRGRVFAFLFDSLYHNAVKSALKKMAEIQYSAGRRYSTDGTEAPNDVLYPLLGYYGSWEKQNTKIAVSTSQYDARVLDAGMLQPIINKPGSTDHMILRATNIWLREGKSFSANLSVDKPLVVYGQTFRATISFPGIKAGAQVAWSVSCTNGDLYRLVQSPNKAFGYVTLDGNGNGYIDFSINWDYVAQNARQFTLMVGLVGYNISRQVIVVPIAGEVFYARNADGSNRVTEVDEGESIYLIAKTTYPFNDLMLYLRQEGGTTVSNADFQDPLPSEVIINNGIGAIPLKVLADQTTEGGETLIYGLYTDIAKQNRLGGLATLYIYDTSTTPIPVYDIYFASNSDGSGRITGDIKLGDTVWLIVTATNVPPFHDIDIHLGGDFDRTENADPDLPAIIHMTLSNGRGSYQIKTVAPDINVPDPGGNAVNKKLVISSNRLYTYNIYQEYLAAFGAPPSGALNITLKINSGVYVVGTDANQPAIDGRGGWSFDTVITIENSGLILGRGGDGGSKSVTNSNTNVPGGNGGVGIIAQSANPIYVKMNFGAVVLGGGGGSGGTYAIDWIYYPNGNVDLWQISTGGSGGAPLGKGHVPDLSENPATGSNVEGYTETWLPYRGTDAGLSGTGGISSNKSPGTSSFYSTTKGGDAGGVGYTSTEPTLGAASANGAAGAAYLGPVYITWN